MLETEVLLRTILFQVKSAKSLSEAVRAIEVMCNDDAIAAVEKKIAESEREATLNR